MRRGDWGSWRQSVNPKLKRKANEGTENGTGVYRDGTIDWLKSAATVDSSQTTAISDRTTVDKSKPLPKNSLPFPVLSFRGDSNRTRVEATANDSRRRGGRLLAYAR